MALRRLPKRRDVAPSTLEAELAEARATGNRDKVLELEAVAASEAMLEFEEERQALTKKLVDEARSLDVLTPPSQKPSGSETGYWERSSQLRYWNLTDAGVEKLRADIRSERRWRQEQRDRLLIWVSALTGLFGAAAALGAVLL